MRRLIRKLILGTASVLALGIGGAALNYAADAGNAVTLESTAAVPQTVQPGGDLPYNSYWVQTQLRKDDIRWHSWSFAVGDSIRDRSMAFWVRRPSARLNSSKGPMV